MPTVSVIIENQKISNSGIDALASAVGRHPSLLQLYLGGHKKVTQVDKLMKELANNKVMELLSLDNCKITDLGAKEIGRFLDRQHFLLELDLTYNKIGSEGMKFIAKGLENNSGLKALIVHSQNAKCAKGMRALRKVAKVKKMKLNKTYVR